MKKKTIKIGQVWCIEGCYPVMVVHDSNHGKWSTVYLAGESYEGEISRYWYSRKDLEANLHADYRLIADSPEEYFQAKAKEENPCKTLLQELDELNCQYKDIVDADHHLMDAARYATMAPHLSSPFTAEKFQEAAERVAKDLPGVKDPNHIPEEGRVLKEPTKVITGKLMKVTINGQEIGFAEDIDYTDRISYVNKDGEEVTAVNLDSSGETIDPKGVDMGFYQRIGDTVKFTAKLTLPEPIEFIVLNEYIKYDPENQLKKKCSCPDSNFVMNAGGCIGCTCGAMK